MSPLLDSLLASLKKTPREIDSHQIIKAWEFASLAHTGQNRLSGDPFITHPTAVAINLAHWNMDTTTIVAGLLHDTIEDGGATREDLVKEFGPEVATLVDGVTKVTSVHFTGSVKEEFVENLRKMLLVMAKDLRVIFVKLADRLHNMQTIQFLSPKSQNENSLETLEIYAPLAERLGMGEVKGQLEDLAFPYVYPSEHKKLLQEAKGLYDESNKVVERFRRDLLKDLTPQIPSAVINIRKKHLYSLFKKLKRPENGGDITKIYDLVAARIIVDTLENCYLALGIVHNLFRPVPYLGIKDYIASPKPNGYQSIHTRVFGPQGRIVEVQIRSQKMHEEAEMGITAHWMYSQLKAKGTSKSKFENFVVPEKLKWVQQLVTWQESVSDNDEFMRSLKLDTFQDRILVFTPIGYL